MNFYFTVMQHSINKPNCTCKHSATGAHAPGLERSHLDAVELARETPETKSPLLKSNQTVLELAAHTRAKDVV